MLSGIVPPPMPSTSIPRALSAPRRAWSSPSRLFATLLALPLLACDTGSRPTPPPAAAAATAAPAASPASTAPARAPAATTVSGRPRDPRAAGLTPGDRFYDGCNGCQVQADGSVGCTELDCPGLELSAAGSTPAAPAPPLAAADQAAVRQAAAQLIKALQARDGAALAALLAPGGAHLSPSPGFEENVNAMSAAEARTCFTRTEKRDWGTQDPSGERVMETCAAHLDAYLKILTTPGVTTTVNTSTLPHATGMDAQVRRYFPGAAWVDYLVAGQGEQAAHSYRGVRLVFTKAADGWRLAGALHEYYLP